MSLTIIFIGVTVAISFLAWNNGSILYGFTMNPYQVFHKKEVWRMLTSGFIHSGYAHLGFNMFTFYFFGRVVEQIFSYVLGPSANATYIVFYVSAVIISDLPVAYRNRNNPNYNSLGASGAVSAMVFSSILFMPLNDICLYAIFCLPGFILGIVYVIYSYYQGRNMSDNINHEAHLYGAGYGLLFSLVIYPEAGPAFFEQILSYRPF
ncbi:MAG: rhomboid family intramembrane serine protease [Cyclobacteriaceae bacterium]|nr:rhomboid family intramembrane serine protease [Cyclobacteriaceae bacterium HetDA_MAG_MS6]